MCMPVQRNRSMLSAMLHALSGRPALAAALLVPLALAAPFAAPEPQGGGTPTLRFQVLAGDGSPAADLKAGDVTLKIDGRRREIESLRFVDLREPAPAVAGSAAAAPAPTSTAPPYATNTRTAGGRGLYLLVDEESVAAGRETGVKDALKTLVAALGPNDRAALVSVRQGGPNIGLTDDPSRLQAGIDKLAGYSNSRESDEDLTCRTSRTIQMVQGVLESVATTELPTVVFFSTQVASLQAGRVGTMATDGRTRVENLCELRTEHFERLGTAASNANATFYSVELLDASASGPSSVASGGLDNLAGSMGGEMIRMGANVADQVARIVRGTSGYYVATFQSDRSDRSGTKRVEVSVARGGVTVRAPRELSPAAPARQAKAVTPRDMIRVATAFTDLPLRAAAYSSRNPGDGKIRILALFEPIESGTKVKSATIAVYDTAGKLTAQWSAQAADLAGPTTIAALLVPAGEYRLRVAATDTSGRAGAVDLKLSAALIEAGSIRLGDLVLGKVSDTGPVPVMQFQSETEALAMIELYGRPEKPLKMYVEVLNPAGEPIQVALAPSASKEPDKFLLSATLPIGSLQPGDYAVRAVVGVEGEPEGQVTCTLRKLSAGS